MKIGYAIWLSSIFTKISQYVKNYCVLNFMKEALHPPDYSGLQIKYVGNFTDGAFSKKESSNYLDTLHDWPGSFCVQVSKPWSKHCFGSSYWGSNSIKPWTLKWRILSTLCRDMGNSGILRKEVISVLQNSASTYFNEAFLFGRYFWLNILHTSDDVLVLSPTSSNI